jgi:hypothetical protein
MSLARPLEAGTENVFLIRDDEMIMVGDPSLKRLG